MPRWSLASKFRPPAVSVLEKCLSFILFLLIHLFSSLLSAADSARYRWSARRSPNLQASCKLSGVFRWRSAFRSPCGGTWPHGTAYVLDPSSTHLVANLLHQLFVFQVVPDLRCHLPRWLLDPFWSMLFQSGIQVNCKASGTACSSTVQACWTW